jgi:hypothetical protein
LADGSQLALHSRYDPESEAAKLAAGIPTAKMLVIVGFGAGYVAEACRSRMDSSSDFERLLLLEPCAELFYSTLKHRDLSVLLGDLRIKLAVGLSADEMVSCLQQSYLPHLFTSIRVITLPGFTKLDFVSDLEKRIVGAIQSIQGDFITQSRFGKRWLFNILSNVRVQNERGLPVMAQKSLPPLRECMVIGAGPSLERHLPNIRDLLSTGCTVIACDAALGFCRYHDIPVDYMVSIDGQSIAYLHLLTGRRNTDPIKSIVVADLCAHPGYGRMAECPEFVGSDHPLISWLRMRGAPLPRIDCSSGNVGGAMVSWADSRGAETIHVFGLDFAYFNGQPYARPSFFHDDRGPKTSRLCPLEQHMVRLYIGDDLCFTPCAAGVSITTTRLRAYEQAFNADLNRIQSTLHIYGNSGKRQVHDSPRPNIRKNDPPAAVGAEGLWDGLAVYRSLVEAEDWNSLDPLELWEHGDREQINLLLTLLPLMAWNMANILQSDPESTDIRRKAFLAAVGQTRQLLARFFT